MCTFIFTELFKDQSNADKNFSLYLIEMLVLNNTCNEGTNILHHHVEQQIKSLWKGSIHPSILSRLSSFGLQGQQSQLWDRTHLSPSTSSSSPGGKRTKVFPGPPRDVISPALPRCAPGLPSSWTCLKHLPRKFTMRHLKPSQLSPLDLEEQHPSPKTLLDVQAPHRISKSCHNAEETYFGHLCPRPSSFRHHPHLVTKCDGQNIDHICSDMIYDQIISSSPTNLTPFFVNQAFTQRIQRLDHP